MSRFPKSWKIKIDINNFQNDFLKICLNFGGSNQIELQPYNQKRVTIWNYTRILSTLIPQTKRLSLH